jgi:hypothetical protein
MMDCCSAGMKVAKTRLMNVYEFVMLEVFNKGFKDVLFVDFG